ncbi:hypothetical protein [Paratractidigestivibacter sp.]|uniref:hypothetical protein n=1 Tax=Paratractidigestivibacter sp. TaxID=2847316 RepID=UPI002AC9F0DA|nr:hypothetical protein [Paratractidigestivibacter sp.]
MNIKTTIKIRTKTEYFRMDFDSAMDAFAAQCAIDGGLPIQEVHEFVECAHAAAMAWEFGPVPYAALFDDMAHAWRLQPTDVGYFDVSDPEAACKAVYDIEC